MRILFVLIFFAFLSCHSKEAVVSPRDKVSVDTICKHLKFEKIDSVKGTLSREQLKNLPTRNIGVEAEKLKHFFD